MDEDKQKKVTLQEMLRLVGEFQRYQHVVLIVIYLMLIPAKYQIFMMYFATVTPSWKCINNTSNISNTIKNMSRNIRSNLNNNKDSACTFNTTLPNTDKSRCSIPRSHWQYTELTSYSMVTELNVDCDSEWLLHLFSSMVFVGYVIGSAVLGWIADKKGRKYVMFPSLAAILTIGFASSFTSNVPVIVLCRFLIGFFYPGVHTQSVILVSEVIAGKYSAIASVILLSSLPVSACILTLKAYLTQQWRILSIICSAPYIVLLFTYRFLPESLPWLMSQNRVDEVRKVLRKIEIWNKHKLPDNIVLDQPKIYMSERKADLKEVLSGWKNALKLTIQAVLWFSIVLCFYGVTLAADDIGGTIYRDFFIISVIEIPVRILTGPACNRFGRKKTALIPLLSCSATLLGIAFIPLHLKTARLAIGIVGKLSVTIATGTTYLWSLELYPVTVRSRMLGVFQVFGLIGAACAPWVAKGMNRFGYGCGFIVMGVLAIIAFCLGTKLPDTRDCLETDKMGNMAVDDEGGENDILCNKTKAEALELLSEKSTTA